MKLQSFNKMSLMKILYSALVRSVLEASPIIRNPQEAYGTKNSKQIYSIPILQRLWGIPAIHAYVPQLMYRIVLVMVGMCA